MQAVSRLSASHTPQAPKPTARGAAIEACVLIPQVRWLLSSKESNNKNVPCSNTALCVRHGMDRDAPVFGWRAGRESRAKAVAPKAFHRTGSGQRPDPPTRQRRRIIPERDSSPAEPHGCRGPLLHKTNTRRNKKPAPRGMGGCAQREASIEGVRFRCTV
jgi:hypothetical protein